MTLDEAIKYCEEVADFNTKEVENGVWRKGSSAERACIEFANERRQLAEWLKELKAYREQGEDAISRQAVLALAKEECDTAIIPYRRFVKDINALPPVTPQQRTGRWIDSHIPESILCECSECGFTCGAYSFNYCPNCGAKMESEEKG